MFDPAGKLPATRQMLTCFLRLALPAIFTNLVGYSAVMVNGVFAGRMNDPVKLAAVGLNSVCVNVMVLSLLLGINSAQETLTSQAFGAG